MNRTRIKRVGDTYYPQVKKYWIWWYIKSPFTTDVLFFRPDNAQLCINVNFNDLDSVKSVIDYYLKLESKYNDTPTYIDYPNL